MSMASSNTIGSIAKPPDSWDRCAVSSDATTRTVKAVDDIGFQIEEGEVVGFLGPNGAGKTTTLKVLSGLLHPTAGRARILGFTPHERKSPFLKQITLVMGQKNQLNWDLPAMESFIVNQAIYDIPADAFRQTLTELTELLDLEPLIDKQVRKLSLGERMKCELAAALLHRPRVLFLDEPTIGLDVVMQTRIRQFVAEYNRRSRGHGDPDQPLHGGRDRPVQTGAHHRPWKIDL